MNKILNSSASHQKVVKPVPRIEEEETLGSTIMIRALNNLEDVLKDLQFVTNLLCETLSKLHLPVTEPSSIDDISELSQSLYYMVPLLCDYSTIESQQIKLHSTKEEINDINITLRSSEDLITRIFEFPKSGLFLTTAECKDLASLIIGAIRDSSSIELKKQVKKLQEKAISFGKLAFGQRKACSNNE